MKTTTAATREHHLNQAFALAQEAEQLEAYAEARQNIRRPADTPATLALLTAVRSGHAATARAFTLRQEIQRHLIIVTELADYSEPTDRPDDRWMASLQEQAHQAKLKAMSERQIADFVSHKNETNRKRSAA